MQRQRGSLVPVAEVVSGLNGPVKAIRDNSPQALHHFTQADQVNQLVSASEADPDLGFMARMMALCSLPRTNPGNRIRYKDSAQNRAKWGIHLTQVATRCCGRAKASTKKRIPPAGRSGLSREREAGVVLVEEDCVFLLAMEDVRVKTPG